MNNKTNDEAIANILKDAPPPLSSNELYSRYGYLIKDMLNSSPGWEPVKGGTPSPIAHAVISLNSRAKTLRTNLLEGIRLLACNSGPGHLQPAFAGTRGMRKGETPQRQNVSFEKEGINCKIRIGTEYRNDALDMQIDLLSPPDTPIRPFFLTIHDETGEELLQRKEFKEHPAVIRGLEPGIYRILAAGNERECEIDVAVDESQT